MTQLGNVYTHKGKFLAKIDARESGERFYMEGPRRQDKQQAAQDLAEIRAAAGGAAAQRFDAAAQRLRDEGKNKSVSNDTLLVCYGLFKQATVGDCNTCKSYMFPFSQCPKGPF